jgi:ribosomal protein L11 methyltransferase
MVFANINRNILLNDMKRYAQCMKPGALLLMSGFYTDDMEAIVEACGKNGLSLEASREKNRWIALKTRLNNII